MPKLPIVPLLRLIALGVALLFAVIVLGLAAGLTATTEKYLGGYFEFAALAIATASITIVTIPVMIAFEFLQPGRVFTSKIAVEISWLFILWVLWLATAADATNAASVNFISRCGDYFSSRIESACRQTAGVQAFSFLNWLILMAYTVFILVLAIIAQSRGHAAIISRRSTESIDGYRPPDSFEEEREGVNMEPYQPQHIHDPGASEGGTGPASVQAGAVHQSV
ncbi:hypothetical protein MIND_00722900 [Mycena indigotica]|uniref:MARVEL domain-containing protein n=1 Tax=Mycena indigotica TaxID=2126181 RepID=A0A8H6W115_9AGAR|nr:uncharacterized protein MIND_00722900 [Mycena indigotica]KAF7301574.1 hypothetical protein MIND_00722900 [Mycena indigotica]